MEWAVLALDQSMTSTGWAFMKKGGKPEWGVKSFPHWGDNEGQYLWEFFEWLGNECSHRGVTHLFLENTFNPQDHHEGLTERIAQYGMIGIADMVRYVCNTKRGMAIDIAMVTPQQWRAPFLGWHKAPNGLAKHQRRKWLKDKAKEQCAKRGWLVDDDNAADALGILMFGCSAIDTSFATTQGPLFRRAEMGFDNEQRNLR